METLEQKYKNDPALLKLYKTKLLIPGWAGELDDLEAAYVAEKLNSDRQLWLSWRRAGHLKGMRRHVTPANAQILAEKLSTIGVDTVSKQIPLLGRIMKQGSAVGNTRAGDVSKLLRVNSGRPKSTGDISRITDWRRRRELAQGVML